MGGRLGCGSFGRNTSVVGVEREPQTRSRMSQQEVVDHCQSCLSGVLGTETRFGLVGVWKKDGEVETVKTCFSGSLLLRWWTDAEQELSRQGFLFINSEQDRPDCRWAENDRKRGTERGENLEPLLSTAVKSNEITGKLHAQTLQLNRDSNLQISVAPATSYPRERRVYNCCMSKYCFMPRLPKVFFL